MSSSRRPWFPWYPKEFIADEKVKSLSDDAELLYRRILDVMWQANALQLPSNCQLLLQQIARGWSKERFDNAWNELVRPGFAILKTTDDGEWIYSERLRSEAKKIETINKKRTDSGKKGGLAKAKQMPSKRLAKAKQTLSHPYPYPDNKEALSSDKAGNNPALDSKLPLPGSKHFTASIPNPDEIIKKCQQIKKFFNDNKFNPFQFVQRCAVKNKHPCAINDALDGLIKMRQDIRGSPWAYAEAIIKTKSGNYHEKQHMAQVEEFKTQWATIAKEFFK